MTLSSKIFKYDAFLSFASQDEQNVRLIWQRLAMSGLHVFWSNDELKHNIGKPFFEVVQDALINSKDFVLVATNNSMTSEWVKKEYQTFFNECHIRSQGNRKIVIYALGNFDIARLPPLLKGLHVATSLMQIINTLGGADIESLKKENEQLRRERGDLVAKLDTLGGADIESLKKENEQLRRERDDLVAQLKKRNENRKNANRPEERTAAIDSRARFENTIENKRELPRTVQLQLKNGSSVDLFDFKIKVRARFMSMAGHKGTSDFEVSCLYVKKQVVKKIPIEENMTIEIQEKASEDEYHRVKIVRREKSTLEGELMPMNEKDIPVVKPGISFTPTAEYLISGLDEDQDEIDISFDDLRRIILPDHVVTPV